MAERIEMAEARLSILRALLKYDLTPSERIALFAELAFREAEKQMRAPKKRGPKPKEES